MNGVDLTYTISIPIVEVIKKDMRELEEQVDGLLVMARVDLIEEMECYKRGIKHDM